jgi:hypothetical protein
MSNPIPEEAFLNVPRAEYAKLLSDLTGANQRADKAEAMLADADTKAELRVRERYASNGMTLPGKLIGAGNHTVTQKESLSGATPRQRLSEGFTVQGG